MFLFCSIQQEESSRTSVPARGGDRRDCATAVLAGLVMIAADQAHVGEARLNALYMKVGCGRAGLHETMVLLKVLQGVCSFV